MVYAGFWRRFGALLIDGLICLIPSILLNMVVPVLGNLLFVFLYRPFFESSEIMATPGKALMGMAVTTETGGRLTFKAALIRWLVSIVSGVCLFLGYLIQPFSPKRQTFHDMMAGAVVIRRGDAGSVDWWNVWLREFKRVFNIAGSSGPAATTPSSAMASLENLHKLYRQGILSEADYNAKKEELLKKI